MPTRTATARWEGTIDRGRGSISLASRRFDAPYSFSSRFESEPGTNPEEFLGAAAAGCFTMALSLALSQLGHPPVRIETTASVGIETSGAGFRIPRVDLRTEAAVPGLDEATFQDQAQAAKSGCPVSNALAASEIRLEARLLLDHHELHPPGPAPRFGSSCQRRAWPDRTRPLPVEPLDDTK